METIGEFITGHFFDMLGLVIGLVYLYFEYRANKWVWIVGVIMPLNSMIVYFSKGLYADFGINIYYLLIGIYGYVLWTRRDKNAETKSDKPAERPVTHTPAGMYVRLVMSTIVLWVALWWLLVNCTNSTVPVADAFTTALSIVAYWMMARKYAEQWLGWLIVDAVCVGLYMYKGLVGYTILYAVYTVVAVFGYRNWCRMVNRKAPSAP